MVSAGAVRSPSKPHSLVTLLPYSEQNGLQTLQNGGEIHTEP